MGGNQRCYSIITPSMGPFQRKQLPFLTFLGLASWLPNPLPVPQGGPEPPGSTPGCCSRRGDAFPEPPAGLKGTFCWRRGPSVPRPALHNSKTTTKTLLPFILALTVCFFEFCEARQPKISQNPLSFSSRSPSGAARSLTGPGVISPLGNVDFAALRPLIPPGWSWRRQTRQQTAQSHAGTGRKR